MNNNQLVITLLFLTLLTGCSVSNQYKRLKNFIEGEDRIEMPGSTAKVSVLLTKDNQIVLPPTAPDEKNVTSEKGHRASEAQLNTQTHVLEQTNDTTIVKESKQHTPKVELEKQAPQVVRTPKQKKINPKTKTKQVSFTGKISGQVQLKRKNKNLSDSNTIVTLKPLDGQALADATKQHTHQIDMKDKIYSPSYLVVNTGEKIEFTNSDEIRHNVFSPSGENAFDLGTYGAGKKRGVTFEQEGIVKIYCNIHPKMATFVAVNKDGISKILDAEGNFKFTNLPPGRYSLEAWNIRGNTQQELSLEKNEQRSVSIDITVKSTKVEAHQNKFGEKYKKKSALFRDEFY